MNSVFLTGWWLFYEGAVLVEGSGVWCLEVFIVVFFEGDFLLKIALIVVFVFLPMLDDGRKVDLFKLFNAVKGNGGYEVVCERELWDLVGEECGLGVNDGLPVKRVYTEYKSVLEGCLEKLCSGKVSYESVLMESLAEVKAMLSDQTENVGDGDEVKGGVDGPNAGSLDSGLTDGGMINDSDVGKMSKGNGDAKEVMEEVNGGKAAVDASNVVNSGETGRSSGLKRKRDSLSDMMSWITHVANNPCDPEIDYIPEKSKWNSYDNQEAWKQVLLFREATFHKKPASIEKLNWQVIL